MTNYTRLLYRELYDYVFFSFEEILFTSVVSSMEQIKKKKSTIIKRALQIKMNYTSNIKYNLKKKKQRRTFPTGMGYEIRPISLLGRFQTSVFTILRHKKPNFKINEYLIFPKILRL